MAKEAGREPPTMDGKPAMDPNSVMGLWVWGPGVSESCRIGETWDGQLCMSGESWEAETIFGILRPNGEWFQTELLFDGKPRSFFLRCRAEGPDVLLLCFKFPGGGFGPVLRAARGTLPPPRTAMLSSAAADVELELGMARVGNLGVRAWHRPAGAPRAPMAVVICPGIPTSQFPTLHAGSRLITELETVLAERHVPVVCFDYGGVGSSSTPSRGSRRDPARWQAPSLERATKDTLAVVAWAKEHLSSTVVMCGFSQGSLCALRAAVQLGLRGFASLSLGCDLPRHGGAGVQKDAIHTALALNSELTCKALYVCGDRDRLTPLNEVRRLLAKRPDGGAGALLESVRSSAHDLAGVEEEAATIVADWAMRLKEDLLAQPAPELVQPDPNPCVVHVACQQCADPRSIGVFHQQLAAGAVVGDLREALRPGLPESARILNAEGLAGLQDRDPVPASVVVSEFAGEISPEMVLTKEQSREAQRLAKEAAEEPAMQRRLDRLEQDTGGSQTKYNARLLDIMFTEVFPVIARRFNIPESEAGVLAMTQAVHKHSEKDMDILQCWLEMETLWRNQARIAKARSAITGMSKQTRAVACA